MGICKDVMDEVRNKHYSNAWKRVIGKNNLTANRNEFVNMC